MRFDVLLFTESRIRIHHIVFLYYISFIIFFQILPSKFLIDAHALGCLDPVEHDDQDDIKEGEQIELPLWIAKGLSNKQYISVELPKIYRIEAQNELLAAPNNWNLKSGPYYYEGTTSF